MAGMGAELKRLSWPKAEWRLSGGRSGEGDVTTVWMVRLVSNSKRTYRDGAIRRASCVIRQERMST
jgi:hypothetical protein